MRIWLRSSPWSFIGWVGDVPIAGRVCEQPGMGGAPMLVLPYYRPLTVPEPIRPDPASCPRVASTTVMEAVARCHGAMSPERFHAWLEAGLRATAGMNGPEVLTLAGRGRQ